MNEKVFRFSCRPTKRGQLCWRQVVKCFEKWFVKPCPQTTVKPTRLIMHQNIPTASCGWGISEPQEWSQVGLKFQQVGSSVETVTLATVLVIRSPPPHFRYLTHKFQNVVYSRLHFVTWYRTSIVSAEWYPCQSNDLTRVHSHVHVHVHVHTIFFSYFQVNILFVSLLPAVPTDLMHYILFATCLRNCPIIRLSQKLTPIDSIYCIYKLNWSVKILKMAA